MPGTAVRVGCGRMDYFIASTAAVRHSTVRRGWRRRYNTGPTPLTGESIKNASICSLAARQLARGRREGG